MIRTEFFTRLSHELRTPLNSIKGAVYYLQHTGKMSRNEQMEFYSIISHETGKLVNTVEGLLDFLRLEDEMKVIRKSMIRVADIVREALDSSALKAVFGEKGLIMHVHIQKNLSAIVGDRVRISQLFISLIDVLSRHLERNDAIKIRISEKDFVEIVLAVSRKMPETMALTAEGPLCRPAFQADQNEEKWRVYLARKIAEAHQWSISARNTNGGFAVSIAIPKGTLPRPS